MNECKLQDGKLERAVEVSLLRSTDIHKTSKSNCQGKASKTFITQTQSKKKENVVITLGSLRCTVTPIS